MRFREFLEEMEMEEGRVGDFLKRGVIGGALALSPLVAGHAPEVDTKTPAAEFTPVDDEAKERAKDRNNYYDAETMSRIVGMAKKGDAWSVREVAWPKDHPFHEMGRPYFRNVGPHPKGLISVW
jgi:hypothetical protein